MSMFSTSPIALIAFGFSVATLYVFQLYVSWLNVRKQIQNCPGIFSLFSMRNAIAHLLPPIPYISLGYNYHWRQKHDIFRQVGSDVIAQYSAWPSIHTKFILADPAAIKEVFSSRSRFPKPVYQYTILSFFGENIVTTEGSEWKRHRKIAAPSFSERNSQLVWDEAVGTMSNLFDGLWGGKKVVVCDNAVDLMVHAALFVIASAGFGQKVSWDDDAILPPGHEMSFKNATHIVSSNLHIKIIFPQWAMSLFEKTRTFRKAYDEFDHYLHEMVADRKTGVKTAERHDLFSNLLEANDKVDLGDEEAKLTDEELVGDVFMFLVAGHETSAHTLSFALGLLALHPDEQEKLYEHITKVIPEGRLPVYEDMPSLTYVEAVLYETLRLFPTVNVIPKLSAEDTVLTTTTITGEKRHVPIPKGTELDIDTVGLHYNPRYWKEPYKFRPARFLEEWPRDAFVPFSVGARACIGRNFFETSASAILAMLVRYYEIAPLEEPQFAGETYEEKAERLLASRPGITLTPIRVPLVFKRRDA